MLRSTLALLLTWTVLATSCLAQFTAEQAAQFAESERQGKLRHAKAAEEELAKAEAAGQTLQTIQMAMEVASIYEAPNSIDQKPLDLAKARQWYAYGASRATGIWSAYCAYHLATMYWEGKGGPQDKERAKYIWMWAAENGDGNAIAQLEKLGYDMRKERARAFEQAKARQAQRAQQAPPMRSQMERAQEGLAIVFGLWLAAYLAGEYGCQAQRQAQLMGGAASSKADCR